MDNKCEACGSRKRACGRYCRTCKSKLHKLCQKAEDKGWVLGTGAQQGWVWDRQGYVLAYAERNLLAALEQAVEAAKT